MYNYLSLPITSSESGFMVAVLYPDKMKVVTQNQLVDVQVLIGNIGGYIGLFLGKKLILI